MNVGQGDATLVTTPNGKTLLIDGGREGKGREVILPYLKDHSIISLDAILATHYDGDHIGGIHEVIEGEDGVFNTPDDRMPKLGIYDRGQAPFDNAPSYPAYLQAVSAHRLSLSEGEKIPLDTSLIIRCVSVNGTLWNAPAVDLTALGFNEVENSASLGLLIEYGRFRYLTAGDLTGGGSPGGYKTFDMETPLSQALGGVTVVHANHHGSQSSSNENYANNLHPQVVVFNVGDGNDYHHPAQEVLERWQAAGAELWLTEKGSGGFMASEHIANGPIEIETDGQTLTINGNSVEIK
ncbi:MAG: MBL fold metallo-hydrolase [bacterium]